MRIAITGGIGSGKTCVLNILEDAGYSVLSCDDVNKKLLTDKQYIANLCNYFPSVVNNNIIDRKKLAEIVFTDKSKLEILNNLSHPIIREIILKETTDDNVNFVEVPLLFESNMEKDFDKILLIKSDINNRIGRVKNRDNRSVAEIEAIINSQIKDYDDRKIDYIITNDGDINNLKKEVKSFLCTLKKQLNIS